jgi:hypothetical protein
MRLVAASIGTGLMGQGIDVTKTNRREFHRLAVVLSMQNDSGSNLRNVPLLAIPQIRNSNHCFMTPLEYLAFIGKEVGIPDQQIKSTLNDAARGRLHITPDLREFGVEVIPT